MGDLPFEKEAASNLTQERLWQIFNYDWAAGKLIWKESKSKFVGLEAGTVRSNGYLRVSVEGVQHSSHRLIWMMVHGEWPKGLIDHIDGDRANNTIENLRIANFSQNRANSKLAKNNKSGAKGVYLNGDRFLVQIAHRGKSKFLGTFETLEEANAAYSKEAVLLYGEFARPEMSKQGSVTQ